MNWAGDSGPRVGCVQRINASAPEILPVLRSTLGWVQREFLVLQREPRASLDRLPLDRLSIHGGLEETVTLTCTVFCLVHCGICICEKGFCVDTVVWINTHTDTGRNIEIAPIDGADL
jgi:hypothetical protein